MARANVRNPMRDLISLREAMDRLLEDSLLHWRGDGRLSERARSLPLDVYATPDEIVVLASLPGLKPEEVEITMKGKTLTIRGEFKPPVENAEYLVKERLYGSFTRTMTFNIPIQADKVEATFENGLLTLVVPKAEEIRPKTIEVRIKQE
jgi:HSP20 family protein